MKDWLLPVSVVTTLGFFNYQSYFAKSEIIATANSRVPASTQTIDRLKIISVECNSSEIPIDSDLQMIRLILPLCQSAQVPEIRNSTNGHTGSVFTLKKSITSDYIKLETGENQIEIRWPNKTVQLVTLQRIQ